MPKAFVKPVSSKDILEQVAVSEESGVVVSLGTIEIVKVVREFKEMKADVYGNTHGELLDVYLREAAQNGEEVQSVTFHIEQQSWNDYAKTLYPKYRNDTDVA